MVLTWNWNFRRQNLQGINKVFIFYLSIYLSMYLEDRCSRSGRWDSAVGFVSTYIARLAVVRSVGKEERENLEGSVALVQCLVQLLTARHDSVEVGGDGENIWWRPGRNSAMRVSKLTTTRWLILVFFGWSWGIYISNVTTADQFSEACIM